ncbi:hypothetical protein MAR_012292, partial [Mya arenaria]
MAKSKAERMREYRARKKEKLGEKEWLKKERARTKAYFKPMALLDESKQLEIRENNRLNQIRFRRKKHEQKNTGVDRSNTELQPSTSTESNENEISSTTDTTITIKLPFPSRAQKGKKRTSRALSKPYRRVETLEDQNEALKRKLSSKRPKTTAKALNVTTCGNPDKFVEMFLDSPSSLNELLNKIPTNDENVKFQQWKRVKMKNGKERQRVVEVEKTR